MIIDDEKTMREAYRDWLENYGQDRDEKFSTVSDQVIAPLYSPLDREGEDFTRDIGFPGSYPYTRGIYNNMHRGRLWTMRQFAGFGSAKDTNERFHYLLAHGGTGLS